MNVGIMLKTMLQGWLLSTSNLREKDDYDYGADGKEIRIKWWRSAIRRSSNSLAADGIQGDVPECVNKHAVDANTIIVIPDAYPRQSEFPVKVWENSQIFMTDGIDINAVPCNDHVNIIGKVLLGIINNDARIAFFPTLSCIGTATDEDVLLMLRNVLDRIVDWTIEGKNIVLTMSISLYRQSAQMQQVIEEILSFPNVAWDIAAGNREFGGLNYCGRSIYSLTNRFPNLVVLGRTRLDPIIPNVIAHNSNYGPCVALYGPGDLIYKSDRVWGTSFVKEIAALKAAYWKIYPDLNGVQITELAVNKIKKIVQANFPDGSSGLATVFSLGSTCSPLTPAAPSKIPTGTPTKIPTKSPVITAVPTVPPTTQDFGVYIFNATGGQSPWQFYIAEKFCLTIKFTNIANVPRKGGIAEVLMASETGEMENNVKVHNPRGEARFFQLLLQKNNTVLNIFRGRGSNRVLAQTHVSAGVPIHYIAFNGANSRYRAQQCLELVREYENEYEATIRAGRAVAKARIAKY